MYNKLWLWQKKLKDRRFRFCIQEEKQIEWKAKYTAKIWTKCEHAKKLPKNSCFQNIQTNTCKNEPGKPVFMRVPRGGCRNGRSPFRALKHKYKTSSHSLPMVEMEEARLGRWNIHFLLFNWKSCLFSRNGRSPVRALKHSTTGNFTLGYSSSK